MGGTGTDTALETADIALMSDDLHKLPYTISLSRRALNIIKQNITFSLGLKIIALLLVIPGWLTNNKDRKSTRLNSSHVAISYAVFCLKKKIEINIQVRK